MSKVADDDLYNGASEEFIPIACHYDESTLITKNGELLQTIEINGINADKISTNLVSLRQIVRSGILNSVNSKDYAVWIHTIRRKANLDDDAEYYGFFSANVHDIWSRKNFWKDKFVNKLYITIVHKALNQNANGLSGFMSSFSTKKVIKSNEEFLEKSLKKLNSTVNDLLENLDEYGAEKLSIKVVDGKVYSGLMFLYRRIMHLNEEECLLPDADISSVLASHKYALGNDRIEVAGEGSKKFAALMSIKEYQDVPSETLSKFLQIPVEMIVTEVFYFVDKKEVKEEFDHQKYILQVSGDKKLAKWKGLEKLDSKLKKDRYCHQQISFMVIGQDQKTLDQQLNQASSALSAIGIVHVKEDIALEKAFWAQLPGNFSCLARMKPAPVSNVAALSSLHNYPTGNQYNPWGKALTLLRGEHGAPYFMNFHDESAKGATCIFGDKDSGKTVLTNFLLSEADKYYTTTLLITDNPDSGLCVKSRGGKWYQRNKDIVNPLLCEDTESNRIYMFEFFKIIAKHHFDLLSKDELKELNKISDSVFDLPYKKRVLSDIIKNIKGNEGLESIKARLLDYTKEGVYYKLFEPEEVIAIEEGGITALSLEGFDDKAYTEKNYPKEKKYIEKFEYDLNAMRAVKSAIILAMQNQIQNTGKGAKIFALDNLHQLCNLEYYSHLPSYFIDAMDAINGVSVFNVNTEPMLKLADKDFKHKWIEQLNTKIIMSSAVSVEGYDTLIGLNESEMNTLSNFKVGYYQFLVNQDGKSVATELSIGGVIGLLKILSCSKYDIEIYKEVVSDLGDKKPEDWVESLYDRLDSAI